MNILDQSRWVGEFRRRTDSRLLPIALGMAVLMFGFQVSASVRAPAVAGAFYPGSEETLRRAVEGYLLEVPEPEPDGSVAALVVPHAGFPYSGATAGRAFRLLQGSQIRRVILIGPSHRMSFSGASLPRQGTTAFRTPLGDVPLDLAGIEVLRESQVFSGPSRAHDEEHCLEVEIPFLQVVASEARLVPILVGAETGRTQLREMARQIKELTDEDTVVVVSTDFTHHGDGYRWAPFPQTPQLGDRLVSLGRATAERVADGDAEGFWQQVKTSGDTVCGRLPVSVLLEMVKHAFAGGGAVLDVTTSGHVLGDFSHSVTYASVAFLGQWGDWREEDEEFDLGRLGVAEEKMILGLARATLETHLAHGPELARWFADNGDRKIWRALSGAFVTLNNAGIRPGEPGRLRACMGVMDARQSLVDAVIQAGVSAAHDPRFPALGLDELVGLELEVSVLSPRKNVSGFEAVNVGLHGVVLSKGGRSAVFLPQVAVEHGWDRETMLTHLARKAGLPGNAWREGAEFEVFTAQVVEEHRGGSSRDEP